jgi:NAD(P)-dependent dehydrogenase (short-subunit alcohol dehydrogenase family)
MFGVRMRPSTGLTTMKPTRTERPICPVGPERGSDLSGLTVLITGASSGIGRAAALALAACGAELILAARRGSALAEVAKEIEQAHGAGVRSLLVDLNDSREMQDAIRTIPRLNALVNNAGLNLPQAFTDVDEGSFDAIFDLNVKAAFFVAQACVRKFRETARGGAIVNVSSQMGHVGAANRTVYCASKHALEGLTKAMAVELAGEGIRVNAVCPTFIATSMTASMLEDPAFRAEVSAKIPLGRVGTVEEVAGSIVFLLSPAASLITGSSLLVDGGWTAQ